LRLVDRGRRRCCEGDSRRQHEAKEQNPSAGQPQPSHARPLRWKTFR
jgi:hypothetical protein